MRQEISSRAAMLRPKLNDTCAGERFSTPSSLAVMNRPLKHCVLDMIGWSWQALSGKNAGTTAHALYRAYPEYSDNLIMVGAIGQNIISIEDVQ